MSMNSHTGFTDSDNEADDEVTSSNGCSDPDHCDRGVDCDGEHTYSLEYYRLREGGDEPSEDKEESTVDYEDDDDTGDADPANLISDSGDDDPAYDSEDAASCS